jgi:hypothetical protein
LTMITLGHAVLIGILGLGAVRGVRAIIADRKQPSPASSSPSSDASTVRVSSAE